VVVAGPTASGKSQLALDLGEVLDITIVCADARQAIRGMQIGTAAPTSDEVERIPHVGYAIRDPEFDYSAAEYAETTRGLIDEIPATSIPVLVGGSGLYLQALLDGFSTDVVATPAEVRDRVQRMLDELGRLAFYDALVSIDPVAAERYADMNPRRVQRALEYYYTTQQRLSDTWSQPRRPAPYAVTWIGVDQTDTDLKTLIAQRCTRMWQQGLVDETQELLNRGIDPSSHIMRTIGYAEAVDVINGISSMDDARQRLLHSTWRYAKRQRTWFRRDNRYVWLRGDRMTITHEAHTLINTIRDAGRS
jgi:tRNA dimethylallyltransferase